MYYVCLSPASQQHFSMSALVGSGSSWSYSLRKEPHRLPRSLASCGSFACRHLLRADLLTSRLQSDMLTC